MTILVDLLIGALLGKAAVWAYNNLLTPEQRKKIESIVKTHHFEYGTAAVAGGALAKSPKTVGFGLSLMADDWKDKDVAIKNLKNKIHSVINQTQQGFQTSNTNYSSPFIHNPRMRQMYRINY